MLKGKNAEMAQVTDDLVKYYQRLADTLQRLSRQFPAMRIDVAAMSEIETDTRKAIGADQAKDFAPLAGHSGVEFEREVLLMFYNALNEQRHLVGVMVGMETDPALKKFLETTQTELEERYAKVWRYWPNAISLIELRWGRAVHYCRDRIKVHTRSFWRATAIPRKSTGSSA